MGHTVGGGGWRVGGRASTTTARDALCGCVPFDLFWRGAGRFGGGAGGVREGEGGRGEEGEEQSRREQEEEEGRRAQEEQEEQLRLETKRMAQEGYQDKVTRDHGLLVEGQLCIVLEMKKKAPLGHGLNGLFSISRFSSASQIGRAHV